MLLALSVTALPNSQSIEKTHRSEPTESRRNVKNLEELLVRATGSPPRGPGSIPSTHMTAHMAAHIVIKATKAGRKATISALLSQSFEVEAGGSGVQNDS